MWLFYTLLTAILWGVGQIFIKKGLSNLSPLFNNVLAAIIVPTLVIPFTLYHGVHYNQIQSISPLTLLVALFFLCFYYIIGMGQVAFTGTIIGIAPIFTIALSLIFLHENPSTFQKLAILIIIIGTTFLALPEKLNNIKEIKMGSWFWWALFGAVIFGTGDFLGKTIISQSDVYTYLFTYAICVIIVTALSILIDKKGRSIPAFNFKKYLPTLVGVTFMELGLISFQFALSGGFASLVTPISSIYVAITAVLAWIFLKEKINKIHFIGIALAAIGVILVGIN